MKITFLGTGAGEGYPGFWCNCPNCRYAREKGGRNIRGNTCTMIDDDVMIDLNVHFYEAALQHHFYPGNIRLALITHPHNDHFNPHWLTQRIVPENLESISGQDLMSHVSPNFTPLPMLHIYGNHFVEEAINKEEKLIKYRERCRFEFHPVIEGEDTRFEDIVFTAVRSRHTNQYGYAHNYIITRGGKTILYASDTGGYDDDMMDIILSRKYDCIIMEGTFGLGKGSSSHMNLEKNRAMFDRFSKANVWKTEPLIYLTHICPHWTPPHDIYAPMMEKEGIHLAWDGLTIEI